MILHTLFYYKGGVLICWLLNCIVVFFQKSFVVSKERKMMVKYSFLKKGMPKNVIFSVSFLMAKKCSSAV